MKWYNQILFVFMITGFSFAQAIDADDITCGLALFPASGQGIIDYFNILNLEGQLKTSEDGKKFFLDKTFRLPEGFPQQLQSISISLTGRTLNWSQAGDVEQTPPDPKNLNSFGGTVRVTDFMNDGEVKNFDIGATSPYWFGSLEGRIKNEKTGISYSSLFLNCHFNHSKKNLSNR